MFHTAYSKLHTFYTHYERFISPTAFAFGFILDNFTLTRIDLWVDNLILFSYLFLAGLGILTIHFRLYTPHANLVPEKLSQWLPAIIQFAFGGLFSGYFVFYSRSASLSGSFLFVAFLIVLLISNERFRTRYLNLTFQVSVFFLALFSFTIFYVPVLLGSMGALVFVLSGIVSLSGIALFLFLLYRIAPRVFLERKGSLVKSVVTIYVTLNVLYFANIIPPVPLSLKDAEVFHKVERVGQNYTVYDERYPWYEIFFPIKTLQISSPSPVYFFSAVFAPTKLNTTIFHEWQYFDGERNRWVTTDTTSFSIIGGRDGGYRGYSIKENISPGKWRVNVETSRGQLVGRRVFIVEEVSAARALRAEIR